MKLQLKKLTKKLGRLEKQTEQTRTSRGRGGPADEDRPNYGSMGDGNKEAPPVGGGNTGDGSVDAPLGVDTGGNKEAPLGGDVDVPLGVDTPLRRRRASTEVND